MKANGFTFEKTGGNCTALIREVYGAEIILTDGNSNAPQAFPCSVYAMAPGIGVIGRDVVSGPDDLQRFICGVTGKEFCL